VQNTYKSIVEGRDWCRGEVTGARTSPVRKGVADGVRPGGKEMV
jgi:hypothetical protein